MFRYSKISIVCLSIIGRWVLLGADCLAQSEQSDTLRLTIEKVIELAEKNSLQAFINENKFVASHWQYKNYQSSKLPTLNLNLQPTTFNRRISEQFDPSDNAYKYFEVQNLNSYGQLSLDQNLIATGGSISVDSNLGRLVNFGDRNSEQYSATQLRLGITQPLFAYNKFKWEKILEPIRYEKAKLTYLQSSEKLAVTALNYFFDLAKAELSMKIASTNMQNADTLYSIGTKRFEITTIKEADLLNLRLEYINNKTAYAQAYNRYLRAKSILVTFLDLPTDIHFRIDVLEVVPEIHIDPSFGLNLAEQNNPQYLAFEENRLRSEQSVESAIRNSGFRANLNTKVGLNQAGSSFTEAYANPLDQETFSLSLNIPIIDWKRAKGRRIIAERDKNAQIATIKQERITLEQDIIMSIIEFNLQAELVKNSKEANDLAQKAYSINKRRFLKGLTDINSLVIQQQKKDAAENKYLAELRNYWIGYYEIRNLTLYDFSKEINLVDQLDGRIKIISK